MSEPWTIKKLLDWTSDYFKKFSIEWPHLEAEILLSHALSVPRIQLYVQFERALKEDELSGYKSLLLRRTKHEPLAYITGHQPFMTLDFDVNPAVLVPRPETEKVVEEVIALAKEIDHPLIADIGVGSGAIAVSVAKYLPQAKVTGTDSSKDAIGVAEKNAQKCGVKERCEFLLGNLLEPLKGQLFDIIVSNPPYIKTGEFPTLQQEIRDFEPREALDGGEDGLKFFKLIVEEAHKHLKPRGCLVLEIGAGQDPAVFGLVKDCGKYSGTKTTKDLSGIKRVLVSRLL